MLVQVKHSKFGFFLTGFYYKGEGECSTHRGRAGELCKNKDEGNKVNTNADTSYTEEIIPEVRELTTLAPKLRRI